MPWVFRILLTFMPLFLLGYIYSGWKLFNGINHVLGWPVDQVRFYLISILGYINCYPMLLLLLHALRLNRIAKSAREGNWFWDVLFGYPFWIGVIYLIEVIPWLLAIDIIKFPLYPIYKKYSTHWLNIQHHVVLSVFAVYLIYVIFKVLADTVRMPVSKIALTFRNLPLSLDGLKIVHISDIQADSRTRKRKIRRYIKKINRLRPHLIFFTGDLVTTGAKYIQLAAAELGNLRAKYGTYACLGDHDYWADAKNVMNCLNESGIKILEDSNQFIRVGNESLLVTFITNIYNKRPILDKLNFLMGQQPRGVLDIVLTHQPSESLIESAADKGYHLFLAGHTHGGQMVFRPFGFTIAAPLFESRFFRGTYNVERMLVNINNGLGFSLAPVRYNAPAEISLIKIVRSIV
ncbi:MAG: metallophosphoesterase [bacterium]